MRLTRTFLETGAAAHFIQVEHRRTAVEYAMAGIRRLHDSNLDLLGHDPFSSEMEGTMRDWVIETLLQGAYLREFHLWEKDCKAYFLAMARKNDANLPEKGKRQRFTAWVSAILGLFDVAVPPEILSVIDQMRDRTNTMKHDAGLELKHFITSDDYTRAIEAIGDFWNHLASCERVGP